MLTSLHHICIETPVYAESLDFYQRIMGFRVVEETPGFHGRAYTSWLESSTIRIELQTPKQSMEGRRAACADGKTQHQGLMHICFTVADLISCIEHLDVLGFTAYVPGKRYYEVLGQPLSKLRAPEGTIIELREA